MDRIHKKISWLRKYFGNKFPVIVTLHKKHYTIQIGEEINTFLYPSIAVSSLPQTLDTLHHVENMVREGILREKTS